MKPALILLALTLLSVAQEKPAIPPFTNGMCNGRHWQVFMDKGNYLVGFLDGLRAARSPSRPYIPEPLSMVELVKAVDRFYQEPENLAIPVPEALRIVALKANGAPQSEIDSVSAAARRKALQAAKQPGE